MVGPVLYLELLLGSRRGRQYAFRWVYAGWLLFELFWIVLVYWWYWMLGVSPSDPDRFHPNTTADVFSACLEWFVIQQFILLLLATPAVVAGAVTDEKTQGTLIYLLTADLTSWEIVIGKLLGRCAQVTILALTGLPVLCFFGIFGGLDLVTLLAIIGTTLVPLFALAAASILASVWNKQTRDAVLALYTIGTIGFVLVWGSHKLVDYFAGTGRPVAAWLGWIPELVAGIDSVLRYFHPLYVLEPAWGGGNLEEFGRRFLCSTLAWGGLGLVCVSLAVWRLRGSYVRQLENEGKKKQPHWWRAKRGAISEEPIRWKERHVEGVAPLVQLRTVPRWLGIVLIFLATVLVSTIILMFHLPPGVGVADVIRMVARADLPAIQQLVFGMVTSDQYFFGMGIVALIIASLVVAIRCSGAVCGEREKQTWEALLLTPLETRQLIRAKLWGIIGASYPYLFAYAIPAIVLACLGGIKAVILIVLLLGTTWLAMWYVGAAGIWCSVRSKTSWRSLLGTLAFSYLGGFLLGVVLSPVILIVALFVWIFLMILDFAIGTTSTRAVGGFATVEYTMFISISLVLAGIFYGAGWYFIFDAEKRVADRERTRHWKDEPFYRPRRRRRAPEVARPRYYS